MKKVLISLASIGAVAGIAFAASGAFFSDTETSQDNTFVAGAIDLKVDSMAHYDGMYCDLTEHVWLDEQTESITPGSSKLPQLLGAPCTGSWELTDLGESHTFFDYSDLKPGDGGENTISLHVDSNPAWACVTINPTLNDDNGSTEPELAVDSPDGDSIFDGELAQNLQFTIWADANCNNVQDGEETTLTQGAGPITPRMWAIADSSTSTGPLDPQSTYCIGVKWNLPIGVGNEAQTDKYMADISFNVVQARNNEQFTCQVQEGFTPNTLRLENEREVSDGPWEVLSGDNIFADLTWTDGSTFNFSLTGQGLALNTNYSLIYYADGWPGNHPGALLGTATTDGSGNITMTGSPELNMDLPAPADGNHAVGAKIWLIPSSAYDTGTHSVTVWPPDFSTWLFEGNVYIHYHDTDL